MSIKYTSFIDKTIKDLEYAEQSKLVKAAKYVVVKIKKKISDQYFTGYHSQPGEPPGRMTGNLRKGIGYMSFPREHDVKVGAGPPAYHAHLLEFGTVPRYAKTKSGKSRYLGEIKPRPFMFSTFDEEQGNIQKILSEPWIWE